MQIAILTFDGFNEIDSQDLCVDRAIADVRPFVIPSALQGAAS